LPALPTPQWEVAAMAAAERHLNMSARDLRLELEELYADYAGCLDEDRFEDWPAFFTEDCLYKIIPRENFERGLPLATWSSEGRAGLLDRVVGIRKTMMYAPRYMRRMITGIRILGWHDGELSVRANYLALETLNDQTTKVFNAGQYQDKLVVVGEHLRFREKLCVVDTLRVPNSLIFPL
jgi:3-phenylpropionate/cinnamic acid dioxygenase small subunit